MTNITTADHLECSQAGDIISWNAGEWKRNGNGGKVEQLRADEGPCRRVSKMHLYVREAPV